MAATEAPLLITVRAFLIGIWARLVVGAATMCRLIVLSRLSILDDPRFCLVEMAEGAIGSVHQNLGGVKRNEDVVVLKSYMLGEIECERLTDFFTLLIKHAGNAKAGPRTLVNKIGDHVFNLVTKANDIAQASLNANQHYSLSNDIFAAFLSPDMTYSCPIWSSQTRAETLEDAQLRKLRNAIAKAHIQSTDHVLEIGTGWGSFSILAVQSTGCRVTTLTLSDEQKSLAEQRIKNAGLQDSIQVLLCDYRELPETMIFDKIVSIEMIEHVGAAYLETYFRCMHRHLKPLGGIGVFQCITIPEARYHSYRARQDFIQRYIFPGGHLPTVSHLVAAINEGSQGQLIVEEIQSVSPHYSRALESWSEAFQSNFENKIKPALNARYTNMNATDHDIFLRKWMYYFSYCSAGFATKTLGDVVITAAREGCLELHE